MEEINDRVIVANRLSDGQVVYLTAEGEWTPRIDRAHAANNETVTDKLMDVAKQAVRDRIVVDPYPIETLEDNGHRTPAKLRERIRLVGPTIRPDLGRNAGADF